MIKHISLDLWNTVYTPNKEYSRARSELIAHHTGCEVREAAETYTSMKKTLDDITEIAGISIGAHECWKLLCRNATTLAPDDVSEQIKREAEHLFLTHPPTFDPQWSEVFKVTKERGITVSITSNTNFISGEVIHALFDQQHQLFKENIDFSIFSDMVRIAKPSMSIFRQMLNQASHIHQQKNHWLANSEVLHVGDNVVCDVRAALRCGFHALYTPNAKATPALILEHLK